MTSRLDVLVICPSTSLLSPAAASLQRVPSGRFPAFSGTISSLRFLVPLPLRLRFLHLCVPVVYRCSLQHCAMPRCRPGPFLQAMPIPLLRRETTRPPRFLGSPCQHAPLFDPGGPFATRLGATNDVAFRSENDVGSTSSFISGLNHAACRPPVYASQPGSPQGYATLGSGGWLILAGSGLSPAGLLQEVSILSFILSSDFPLLQALPGALAVDPFQSI